MRVFEIYTSVQGETRHAGRPCTLVRFSACDLRCSYCDTEYAFSGGTDMSIDEIVAEVGGMGPRLVLLTGGEPMLQHDLAALAGRLLGDGFEVMLETSGAHDIAPLPDGVVTILDIKTPGSGEAGRNFWPNLDRLGHKDAVKFVLTSEADYRFAAQVIRERDLAAKTEVLLSPAWGLVDPKDLVAWMLRDRLEARLNLQIHKYVWGSEAQRV